MNKDACYTYRMWWLHSEIHILTSIMFSWLETEKSRAVSGSWLMCREENIGLCHFLMDMGRELKKSWESGWIMQLMTRQPGHRVSFLFFYLSTLDKTELKRPGRKNSTKIVVVERLVQCRVHCILSFCTKYFFRIQIFLFSWIISVVDVV